VARREDFATLCGEVGISLFQTTQGSSSSLGSSKAQSRIAKIAETSTRLMPVGKNIGLDFVHGLAFHKHTPFGVLYQGIPEVFKIFKK